MAVVKHGRQAAVPYQGKPATPWKYTFNGKPVRRGKTYFARMYDADGRLIWEGKVLG